MRIAATLAASAIASPAMAFLAVSTANAVPGDPMAGCETQVFANYCDGPIREDGEPPRVWCTPVYWCAASDWAVFVA